MDILIKLLKPDLLEAKVSEFIGLLSDEPGEYWKESHFLLPLQGKFELSIVGIQGANIVGYIIASLKENGPYIHKFLVRKDFRRRSVGKKMLDFFEKNISEKGFSSIILSVREENELAIKFYRKNMFEVSGSRRDQADNSVLLTMTKFLTVSGKPC